MREHTMEYGILPNSTQIKATTGETIESVDDMDEGHSEWFLNEFESFTRRQELERAIGVRYSQMMLKYHQLIEYMKEVIKLNLAVTDDPVVLATDMLISLVGVPIIKSLEACIQFIELALMLISIPSVSPAPRPKLSYRNVSLAHRPLGRSVVFPSQSLSLKIATADGYPLVAFQDSTSNVQAIASSEESRALTTSP